MSRKGSAFVEVKASYRAWFGRDGEAIYSLERRSWSMPLAARRRLEYWLAESFAGLTA